MFIVAVNHIISLLDATEAAQKDLRKRGVVLAAKKTSRTAAEGLLSLAQMDKKAVVVELNCETDFVARNDTFQYLVSIYLPMVNRSRVYNDAQ